ncbi:MAG: hypothetical protein EXQ87_08550 [Alphaproteobacteria bacterium]|nr:hypothetical protein [Alphaproteobacteria bacterium]
MNTVDVVTPTILDRAITGRKAWTRADLAPADWLVPIPDKCLAEIAATVATLSRHPLPTLVLSPRDYGLTATSTFMGQVKTQLDEGPGLVVLDRLPVEAYGKDELTRIYWLLSSLIARPVAQSFDGTLLYDVIDTGAKIATRVRGDKTNQELIWHTDYGFNHPPPYIGLLVLRTATAGGRSSVVSLTSAHNAMLARHPDLLARLYQPFHWNRQGEHGEGEPITHSLPIFRYAGRRLYGRYNRRLIEAGARLAETPLTNMDVAALDALVGVMNDPALGVDFDMEPGQIQYLANFDCAHRRTDYVDHDAADAKRHLVRIFLRDEGARSYMG